MSSPNWLTDQEMRLWRAFIAAASGVSTSCEASLKNFHDLSLDDYEVLVHLSEAEDNRLRMSELSANLLHSRSRLTQRVDRLQRRGYVSRERHDQDGRGTWAVLDERGLKALEDAAPCHLADARSCFFDHIDPEDVPTLMRALESVALNLRS